MKINLTVDDDLADSIVCGVLLESITLTQNQIKDLKKKKKRAPYEERDLIESQTVLDALVVAHKYYAGHN